MHGSRLEGDGRQSHSQGDDEKRPDGHHKGYDRPGKHPQAACQKHRPQHDEEHSVRSLGHGTGTPLLGWAGEGDNRRPEGDDQHGEGPEQSRDASQIGKQSEHGHQRRRDAGDNAQAR